VDACSADVLRHGILTPLHGLCQAKQWLPYEDPCRIYRRWLATITETQSALRTSPDKTSAAPMADKKGVEAGTRNPVVLPLNSSSVAAKLHHSCGSPLIVTSVASLRL
jgi:hypothetical protein